MAPIALRFRSGFRGRDGLAKRCVTLNTRFYRASSKTLQYMSALRSREGQGHWELCPACRSILTSEGRLGCESNHRQFNASSLYAFWGHAPTRPYMVYAKHRETKPHASSRVLCTQAFAVPGQSSTRLGSAQHGRESKLKQLRVVTPSNLGPTWDMALFPALGFWLPLGTPTRHKLWPCKASWHLHAYNPRTSKPCKPDTPKPLHAPIIADPPTCKPCKPQVGRPTLPPSRNGIRVVAPRCPIRA